MLLQHAWLAPLVKPETITEEEEEEAEATATSQDEGASEAASDKVSPVPDEMVVDQEVADWVKNAIEKRKKGQMKGVQKPALHAAPLEAMQSPTKTDTNGVDAAAPVEATA